MKIKFKLGPKTTKQLMEILADIEVPASELASVAKEYLETLEADRDGQVIVEGYVYPDRTTAERVAHRLLNRYPGNGEIELRYLDRRRTVSESFGAPATGRAKKPAVAPEVAPEGAISEPVAVKVKFTAEQYDRLVRATKVIGNGVTVKELVIAGALFSLDNSASPAADAIEGTLGLVKSYARKRKVYADPEYGTHPLQCAGSWMIEKSPKSSGSADSLPCALERRLRERFGEAGSS